MNIIKAEIVTFQTIETSNFNNVNVTIQQNTSEDTTEETKHAMWRDEELAKIEIAVQGAILTLAIFGNLCVLYALWNRKRKVTRMHIFIMHLSIADLLVAIFNILPQLIWDITNKFEGGDFLCRFIKFMQVFVMYLSTYILVMTALDRYRAICHPLSNHTWTPRLIKLTVGFAYFISGLLSIPQFIIFKLRSLDDKGTVNCWADFSPEWTLDFYVISFTALVYIIPLIILFACYGSICFTIWKKYRLSEESGNYIQRDCRTQRRSSATLTVVNGNTLRRTSAVSTDDNSDSPRRRSALLNGSNGRSRRRTVLTYNSKKTPAVNIILRSHSFRGFSRAKLKTVKMTFVIIVAYITCWSPFFISQLWWLWNPIAPHYNDAMVIMLLLGSLNSCCNPWIYLAFSVNLISNLNPCKCRNDFTGEEKVFACLCSCAESRGNNTAMMKNGLPRESVTSTKSTVVTFSPDHKKIKTIIPLKEL